MLLEGFVYGWHVIDTRAPGRLTPRPRAASSADELALRPDRLESCRQISYYVDRRNYPGGASLEESDVRQGQVLAPEMIFL